MRSTFSSSRAVQATKTWIISSESKLLSAFTFATLAEDQLDKPLDEVLPEALPEVLALEDLEFDPDAFSSCSCLRVQHSEMLCPLHLQWVHFFPFSCFFLPLPVLFV